MQNWLLFVGVLDVSNVQTHSRTFINACASQLIGQEKVAICAARCVKLLRIGHPFVSTVRFVFQFVWDLSASLLLSIPREDET